MARFDAGNSIDFAFDLQEGGTGILGVPVLERTANISAEITDVRAFEDRATLIAPSLNIDFRYTSNSVFQMDASKTAFGITGEFFQEVMTLNLRSVYFLDVGNLQIQDYFRDETWETVFSGNDQITLGNLSDLVRANTGNDTVYGQGGDDTVEGGDGADLIYGDDGADTIYAGRGADTVQGGKNADFIHGGGGFDDLRGGNGHDLIYGGLGNDTIRGAKGTDTLSGAEGADVFIFATELDGVINIDTITDFEHGVDKIELSSTIFTAFAGETGAPPSIGEHIVFKNSTRELVYYPSGFGPGDALVFARLGVDSDVPTIGDFWIVA